ncbi:hypothetical protein CXG81DRAFT_28886 [Caulochytrium protostelioides]|uniref:Uncharacterized protein n=1 Tax=Caulochytrium protostelioides TaxID=1555241 RepID=A0A4P9X2E4_9FUNG|nr:hypothetical protein CXG81DRAFT_28886 [Caulochytrium protostelioides]|eukprot:RKO98276.1 hypothetical protein CXG81DRAFT_28886 [Caulochytrium protostelioides]
MEASAEEPDAGWPGVGGPLAPAPVPAPVAEDDGRGAAAFDGVPTAVALPPPMADPEGDPVSPPFSLSGLHKRCFDGVQDVMNAQLPDLTNLSFYQQITLGVASARKPDTYVRDYYRDYPLLAARLPTQRYLGDTNINVAGATKYRTNLFNYFQLSFETRVK